MRKEDSVIELNDFTNRWELHIHDVMNEHDRLDELIPDDGDDDESVRIAALNLLEADGGYNLLKLREWVDAIGKYETLLTKKGMIGECEETMDEAIAHLPAWVVVDRGESINNLQEDYTEVEIDDYTFYTRG